MPTREENCVSARQPSSLTCDVVISKTQASSLSHESQSIIARIPDFFKNLQQTYGLDYTNLRDYTMDKDSTETRYLIAESLYNDYMAGSPAGSVFLKLGHRIDQVPSDVSGQLINVLRPSLNLSEIYQKLYSLLLPKVSDKIKIEDLIIPAFIFTRINPESNKQEIVMSRPGLDPIPDPSMGWMLKEQALLDLPTFALHLSQGKIPLEHKMYHHDIAHSVDYILSPHLVKWYKAYHKAIYERSLLYGVKPNLNLATEYLHEFLMFPKTDAKAILLNLIQAQKTPQARQAREKNRLDELRDQTNFMYAF